MRLEDFDYELPEERIAQEPVAVRDRARLFAHDVATDRSEHRTVRELGDFLRPHDLLVLNDTRVLSARLFARRSTGGRVEFLFLEPLPGDALTWRALAHPARRLRQDELLWLEDGPFRVHVLEREQHPDGTVAMEWTVRLLEGSAEGSGEPVDPELVFARAGHVPLPPYVTRGDRALDAERYQTVYAARPGAVAAPTAGLHFTPELLEELAGRGVRRAMVTLHVGPGTFQPVKSARIEEHVMHSERYELGPDAVRAVQEARAAGGRVVAVGTTSVRVLESCVDEGGTLRAGRGSTRLFLHPGARFRVVDALLTNFHLPRSTLLMLVCAFAGHERVLRLYREAIERGYRFYSYGDAQFLYRSR